MDKDVGMAARSNAGLVQELSAVGAEFVDGCVKIIHLKRNMMQTGASAGNETGDGRFVIGCFQQLNSRLPTAGQHGNIHMFGRDRFLMSYRHTEKVAVKCETFVQGANGYSEMINFNWHRASVLAVLLSRP